MYALTVAYDEELDLGCAFYVDAEIYSECVHDALPDAGESLADWCRRVAHGRRGEIVFDRASTEEDLARHGAPRSLI